MKIAFCTLFEHHYHLGAAVLVNSLVRAGFNGTVYAGFRGPLPPWAEAKAKVKGENQWEMTVTPEVRIVFLALQTTAHFTNFKPDFLLQVERIAGPETEAVIYCDPDIVVTTNWTYIEEWLTCGVALCEDVNSPLSENHPRRVGWRRFFKPFRFDLTFRGSAFANGGFVGLLWEHRQFLVTWQTLMAHVATELGGLDVVGIGGGRKLQGQYGFADCFHNTDQDALNATVQARPEIPISFLGPQTMGFVAGKALLPHALGAAKPWRRRYIREALGGIAPATVDKAFWSCTEGPIRPFSQVELFWKRVQLTVGAALGRFIRRV